MNKNTNSADVRRLTRAIAKAQSKRRSPLKSLSDIEVCMALRETSKTNSSIINEF